jgi:hypothetical protein
VYPVLTGLTVTATVVGGRRRRHEPGGCFFSIPDILVLFLFYFLQLILCYVSRYILILDIFIFVKDNMDQREYFILKLFRYNMIG